MHTVQVSESTKVFGKKEISKIDKYGWNVADIPGVFMLINKNELRVDNGDDGYQRTISNMSKVNGIARKWSWVACGAIVVALRDNMMWVVDGQHRVAAARQRSDITDLPCMVFESSGKKEEAEGFLTTQIMRKAVTPLEKHKAMLMIGNKAAIVVQDLIDQAGRSMSTMTGPSSISCVARLTVCAENNEAKLRNIWPLIVKLASGEGLTGTLVEGLLSIESRLDYGVSLMDDKWLERTLKVGYKKLIDGAARSVAYHGKGGAKIWGMGMENAINHGLKYRLPIRDGEQQYD